MTETSLDAVRVVLFEPQNPINIAATVRAMKNMGASRLRLVRPGRVRSVSPRGHRARHDGHHRGDRAVRHVRRRGRRLRARRRLHRAPPRRQVADHRRRGRPPPSCSSYAPDGPVALVFGREDTDCRTRCSTSARRRHDSDDRSRVAQPRAGGADRALRAAPRRRRRDAGARVRRARTRRRRRQHEFEQFFADAERALARSSSSRRASPSTSCGRCAR